MNDIQTEQSFQDKTWKNLFLEILGGYVLIVIIAAVFAVPQVGLFLGYRLDIGDAVLPGDELTFELWYNRFCQWIRTPVTFFSLFVTVRIILFCFCKSISFRLVGGYVSRAVKRYIDDYVRSCYMFFTLCVCITSFLYIPFLMTHPPNRWVSSHWKFNDILNFPWSLYEAIFITVLASVFFRCFVLLKTILMRFNLMPEPNEKTITDGIYSILFRYVLKTGRELKIGIVILLTYTVLFMVYCRSL